MKYYSEIPKVTEGLKHRSSNFIKSAWSRLSSRMKFRTRDHEMLGVHSGFKNNGDLLAPV
jgi:hypothetical protein